MKLKKRRKFVLTQEHLYKSIGHTVEKLKTQPMSLLDLKIIDASLKELWYTAKVFAPYRHRRKITVFGSARSRPSDPSYQQAKQLGQEMVRLGYMVVTGAGPGIMQAAQEGAGSMGSFGLNIRLPFEQKANPIIQGDSKLINFKYFFTRKLSMVKESDALVLFPGGFGTQDELFETLTLLQTGKTNPVPVICIETYWQDWKKLYLDNLLKRKLISLEDLNFIYFTEDVEKAVSHITHFYHNYHSMRFYQKWLLIYVWRIPSKKELHKISQSFRPLLTSGAITEAQHHHLPHDPDIEGMPLKTLRLHFNQKNFGLLRNLIDTLNRI
ncbi:MAG: TIGR00730 family Rossman fold protein [Deltaproteobacteria bacterium]|nr:TIGR00730 family Rossman fold protein [Deltaproteobacteria bacterium]